MATGLVYLSDAIAEVTSTATLLRAADAAAKTLTDVMRQGTASAIGADLRMSGFPGAPPTFVEQRSPGGASLRIGGGTYALADAGRKRARARILPKKARRPKRSRRKGAPCGRPAAVMTPRGPRLSVRGSRWAGFAITDTYGPKALEEAATAAAAVVVDRFARV